MLHVNQVGVIPLTQSCPTAPNCYKCLSVLLWNLGYPKIKVRRAEKAELEKRTAAGQKLTSNYVTRFNLENCFSV